MDPLATWVGACPEFKVLNTVVVPDAVDVVNGFVGGQAASYVLFHHITMLKDVLAGRRNSWTSDLDIAVMGMPPIYAIAAPGLIKWYAVAMALGMASAEPV